MAWDNTRPADTRKWDLAAGDIRDNWDALEGILGVDLDTNTVDFSVDSLTSNDIITKGPWLDVRAFGATGDGVTDDTATIMLAVAQLVSDGGGVLYFPEGDYRIVPTVTGAINITDLAHFKIVGNKAKIFCDAYSAADAGSKILVYLTNCSHWSISGIHFLHQIDFATDGTTASNDETLRIDYDDSDPHSTGETSNFEIFNNTFEYNGPFINAGGRDLYIVHLNGDQSTFPLRQVRDFSIYGNHFKKCIGRTLQIFRCANGTVFGNNWEELGYLVHPSGTYKTWAEAKGVRISSSSNISVTCNTLTGYSGVLVAEGGKGNVDFIGTNTVAGDAGSGHGETTVISGNNIKVNTVDGIGIYINHTYSAVVTGNNILGDVTNTQAGFQGIVYATGPTVDTICARNIIKDVPIFFDTLHAEAYTNNIVDDNLLVIGGNIEDVYKNGAETNLILGKNYRSDSGGWDIRNAEGLLSRTAGVDVNTVGAKIPLYTVPLNSKCIITRVVFHTANGTLAGLIDVDFGVTASADTWLTNIINLGEITLTTDYMVVDRPNAEDTTHNNEYQVIDGDDGTLANTIFGIKIIDGATENPATVTIDVFGYLF
jgi:hypothetical protein